MMANLNVNFNDQIVKKEVTLADFKWGFRDEDEEVNNIITQTNTSTMHVPQTLPTVIDTRAEKMFTHNNVKNTT